MACVTAKVDGKTCTDVNECDLNVGVCRGGGTWFFHVHLSTWIDTGSYWQEACYTEYRHGQCSNPLEGIFSRILCCCSSVGKVWGGGDTGISRCEPCPRSGTQAHQELCPKGNGFIDRKDINECTEFPGMCSNGRRKNTVGGFSCKCNQGYGIKCIDIDECSILHGVCGDGTCRNTPGKFICDCKEGYESTMMIHVCMDINGCERIPGLCRGGVCIDTPGSYRCECPPGHELAPNKKACKDIDECSPTSGICSNGVCENMMGTYQCVCDDGYQQTGQKSHCEDVDECKSSNAGCDDICMNTPGSYSCACSTGYMLLLDGRSCTDVDECKENPRICTNGLLPGPYSTSCVDVNEREMEEDVCENGECDNTLGSFMSRCEEGYSAKPDSGPGCTDDDECELDSYNCDMNADRINIPCVCDAGF